MTRLRGADDLATPIGREVILYARSGSPDQFFAECDAERQIEALRGFCDTNALAILFEFIDVGPIEEEDHMARHDMLDFLWANPGKTILVTNLERLTRSLDFLRVIDLYGCRVVSLELEDED